jgi:hypothetical protein
MPLSAQEAQNLVNASLDYHLRGQPESQLIQDRPLYNNLVAMKKEFPGGKEFITEPVKGVYTSAMRGYSHDDEQEYVNPANVKRTSVRWYECSAGISITFTELKMNGIVVTDGGGDRWKTSTVTEAELIQLTNIFDDKVEDLMEGSARSLAEMFWRDGTQDPKAIPGVLSFIFDAPTTGTTFGLDRGTNSWWRNRASIGIDSSTANNQNLVNTLQKEFRQLRRYATPKHKFYAGSDFMDAFEKELRARGNYTLEGWAKSNKIDASVADIAFKGVDVIYEPLLDDLGRSKYGYVLDHNAVKFRPMAGEWMKRHTPTRPVEKLAIYMAMTVTGAITANRLNSSGVYSVL